jgi:CheY-like chemotaxis protein
MRENRHILVVEDDHAIREVVTEILEYEGFVVTSASNGADALERLAGPGERPGLILLDLMMPVMDGWAFRQAQAGRPELASIPVVVFSAIAGQDARADNLSAAAVLAKPFELQRLLDAVELHCQAA